MGTSPTSNKDDGNGSGSGEYVDAEEGCLLQQPLLVSSSSNSQNRNDVVSHALNTWGSDRKIDGCDLPSSRNDIPASPPKGAEEYGKSIVYGGLDAIVTSFALVASISGGSLSSGAVLVLGFANLIADGISMGLSDFVSSSTERDLTFASRKATIWRMGKDPHSQILDLVDTYKAQGMSEEDALMVVECFSKYKQLLVDQKMTMEQGLVNPDPSESLWKNGFVTFISFIGFGCTPLLAYVVLNPFTENNRLKFGAACIVTAVALIVLGLAKAKISGRKYTSSISMVLLNGALAAGVAYLIGWLLTNVLHINA